MAITAAMVKELRDTTGAGMMDAKKALTETDGDMEAAVDWLRTKGLATAAKKSGRTAAEGLVGVLVEGGRGAVLSYDGELTVNIPFLGPGLAKQAAPLLLEALEIQQRVGDEYLAT